MLLSSMQAMTPIAEQLAESKAVHVQVADSRPAPCKICGAASPLLGVVDFHKSCIEAQGRRLAVSGYPVYYRRCPECSFVFTTAFDAWDWNTFSEHIYNSDYVVVDPDYVELRPAGNAHLIANSFPEARGSIKILDYGGGTGVLAARLRDQGFAATTYDPFSSFNDLPQETFDLITCFEVLEHAPYPQETVATMISLLKRPGAILFSTLVQPAEFDSIGLNWWYASPRNGHVSLYSTHALTLVFKPYGLRVGSFSPDLHIAYGEIPAFASRLKLPA